MQELMNNLGLTLQVTHPNPYKTVLENDFLEVSGKGLSAAQAEVDAQRKLIALLSTNVLFQDLYLGEDFEDAEVVHDPKEAWEEIEDSLPETFLTPELWSFYDPENELMPDEIFDTNLGEDERGIAALPFFKEGSDTAIFFPVNIIANIYLDAGLGSGKNSDEAYVDALCKVIKQYVQKRVISETLSLPKFSNAVVAEVEGIQTHLNQLKNEGFGLDFYDASLGGMYPVLALLVTHPSSRQIKLLFGSGLHFESALEDLMTTLLADKETGFTTPTFDEESIKDIANIKQHYQDSSGLISYEFFNTEESFEPMAWDGSYTFESVMQNLTEQGFEIYSRHNRYLGVDVCQMIIPKMSEVNEMRDLQWENNNEGAQYRETILDLHGLDEDDIEDLLEEIEDSEFDPFSNVAKLIGVIPDAGSVWKALTMGELKAMLHLAVGEYEEALTWHKWALEHSAFSDARKAYLACIIAFLEVILDDKKEMVAYLPNLVNLYGAEQVQVCNDLIQEKQKFYGLHESSLELEGFKTHKKAVALYSKILQMKVAYWEAIDA